MPLRLLTAVGTLWTSALVLAAVYCTFTALVHWAWAHIALLVGAALITGAFIVITSAYTWTCSVLGKHNSL